MSIDKEFEEFVLNNYKKLTDNQRKLCEKMGVCLPQ